MTSKDLREERGSAVVEMRKLTDLIHEEKREFTAEEEETYDEFGLKSSAFDAKVVLKRWKSRVEWTWRCGYFDKSFRDRLIDKVVDVWGRDDTPMKLMQVWGKVPSRVWESITTPSAGSDYDAWHERFQRELGWSLRRHRDAGTVTPPPKKELPPAKNPDLDL